jgi:hypothetical protein
MLKDHDVYEVDDDQQQQQQAMTAECGNLDSSEALRFQLLVLSKEILMGRAAMKWETHKQYESISVNDIVAEADKMYTFVKGTP